LKKAFSYDESWLDVSVEDFIELVDKYIERDNNRRIRLTLGRISIIKHLKAVCCGIGSPSNENAIYNRRDLLNDDAGWVSMSCLT